MVGSPNHKLLMEEAPVSLQASLVPLLASQKDFGTQTWSVQLPESSSCLPLRDWVLLGAELGRLLKVDGEMQRHHWFMEHP